MQIKILYCEVNLPLHVWGGGKCIALKQQVSQNANFKKPISYLLNIRQITFLNWTVIWLKNWSTIFFLGVVKAFFGAAVTNSCCVFRTAKACLHRFIEIWQKTYLNIIKNIFFLSKKYFFKMIYLLQDYYVQNWLNLL